MTQVIYFRLAAIAGLLGLLGTAGLASPAPTICAKVVTSAPRVDGALDDECWKSAERCTGFKETLRSADSAEQTEVMVCADAGTLYFAFVCHDSKPDRISARQRQRNASLRGDDNVTVLIDTLHSDKSYYQFTTNPLGTQNESIPYGSASNITWRGDWQAAARITDFGWTAEIAVPFGILRHPAKATTFGMAFTRYNARLDERSMWPDMGISFDFARSCDLTGLDLPTDGIRPVFLPYVVASTEPGRTFTQQGFDLKTEFPNGLTGLLTQNPDFTNVQDSVSSVDFSYYP